VHGAGTEVATGVVPRVLYTEPELAQVGLKESEALQSHGEVRVLHWTYDHNDRAAAERTPWGMVKVMVDRKGQILGAGVVGPHAGEVIQKWALAMSAGLDIQAVAAMIAPYPTIGYSDRKLAESFAGPALLVKYRAREVAEHNPTTAIDRQYRANAE
jgi:pyruvate/2-oxoglutarate dehydrogenase complex dihydrolipoamide dehydrogenase (E3) component